MVKGLRERESKFNKKEKEEREHREFVEMEQEGRERERVNRGDAINELILFVYNTQLQ